jgi:hypothetical protein
MTNIYRFVSVISQMTTGVKFVTLTNIVIMVIKVILTN